MPQYNKVQSSLLVMLFLFRIQIYAAEVKRQLNDIIVNYVKNRELRQFVTDNFISLTYYHIFMKILDRKYQKLL